MKMQELMTAKEKTEMENRSLQNKMKVLQMNEEKGANNDKAKEELLNLNEELTKERKEAIKSKERIAQLQKQVDELRAKGDGAAAPSAANDAMIEDLSAEVAWLHHKLDETTEELERANEELAQAQELMSEIDKFEQVKKRKDDEIADLKSRLENAGKTDNTQLDELKESNESLKKQIEELKKQLKDAKEAKVEKDDDPILNDLDDGIEFTGDKDQMSLFK